MKQSPFRISTFGWLEAITTIIKDYIKKESRYSITEVAGLLGMSRQNFNSKMRANDLTMGFVLDVCKVLKYDFFALYSKTLEREGVVSRDYDYTNKDYKEKYISVLEENRELYGKVVDTDKKIMSLQQLNLN